MKIAAENIFFFQQVYEKTAKKATFLLSVLQILNNTKFFNLLNIHIKWYKIVQWEVLLL